MLTAGRIRLVVLRTGRSLQATFHIFSEGRCFFSAAALAYFALLSLIPFFILAVSALGFLLADIDVIQANVFVAEFAERFMPFLQGELELRLLELIETRSVTGLIGVVVLIGAAALFFLAIEQAFSGIFPASAERGFWHSKGMALALLPALVALLGLLHYTFIVVDTILGFLSAPIFERLLDSAVIDRVMSVAILAVDFILVVYWFERRRIRFRHIAVGAGVFCGLWTAARIGFSFYVQRIVSFSIIYGSLGTLVVLVVWVYYGALVFLIACCLTEALRRQTPG